MSRPPSPTLPAGQTPEPDEIRVRHLLARLGARPVGHTHFPRNPVSDTREPITPTRVFPGGAPLPARPPEPDEIPPWRQPPPPPAPVADAPPPPPAWPTPPPMPSPEPSGPLEVRVTVDLVPAAPEEEPPALWARAWDWLTATLFTWRMLLALLLAVVPWHRGYSPVAAWGYVVQQARADSGALFGYALAAVATAVAYCLDRRTGRFLPRFLLVTAGLGGLAVVRWLDPLTALTGVTR